ncbi:MAG: HAD family hydrolase [Thermoproteota archaeon]|nr:HAD family hydrolase [Thermoproteota archaeon]
MQHRAVFLDRDGVLNKHRPDYVKSIHEFEILPDVQFYLAELQELGFKLFIITNQSAVNRGLLSSRELKAIHDFLIQQLAAFGCSIDGIFYCPHRPDENCDCRKPKTKMFLDVSRQYNIDLSKSWVIGDSETDIEAGSRIGCNAIKIGTNNSLEKAVCVIRYRMKHKMHNQHTTAYVL